MKSRCKLSKSCSITIKTVKFLVRVISEHSYKAISMIFETETVGPCLFWKMKCVCGGVRGGGGGPGPPLVPPVAVPAFPCRIAISEVNAKTNKMVSTKWTKEQRTEFCQ